MKTILLYVTWRGKKEPDVEMLEVDDDASVDEIQEICDKLAAERAEISAWYEEIEER